MKMLYTYASKETIMKNDKQFYRRAYLEGEDGKYSLVYTPITILGPECAATGIFGCVSRRAIEGLGTLMTEMSLSIGQIWEVTGLIADGK